MRALAPDDTAIEYRGALDLDRATSGIAPRRLPAWTQPQLPDALTRVTVAMTAGVRLAFTTDTNTLELDARPSTFEIPELPARPVTFELVIDRTSVVADSTTDGDRIQFDLARNRFELVPGRAATLRFTDLGADPKDCELWLPHNATVELHELRVDDGAELGPPRAARLPRWIHYGSSISHCVEAPTPTTTWPALVARRAGLDLLDLGLAGSCHLDQFVARTIRDEPADCISMKVGVNVINFDSLRERAFHPALHGFVDTVRDGHPDTPLLVVSPIIFPAAEDTPGPTVADGQGGWRTVDASAEARTGSLTAARCRSIIAEFVAARRAGGDTNIHYLDGRELFGAHDLDDLPDGLHPNPRGYARIAERFITFGFDQDGPFASVLDSN